MNGEDRFGTLDDVALADAWSHEAHDFTPWLSQNLDRLSKAVGIPLELTDTEVAVESFSADILARCPLDDSAVLIENQFKSSDHCHLGQIMTYLAGLEAKTIIWIAPAFRAAHLSAIRWLNEHTDEPFKFFAIQLRVVRIGSSPMVPLFDVIERPNNWDRKVQEIARESREPSSLWTLRSRFWARLLERHPSEGEAGKGYAASSRWRAIPGIGLVVVQYISKGGVGVFVRGERGVEPEATSERLAPFAERLTDRLGAEFNEQSDNFFFIKKLQLDTQDDKNWDRAADWLKTEADRYVQTLQEALGGKA